MNYITLDEKSAYFSFDFYVKSKVTDDKTFLV